MINWKRARRYWTHIYQSNSSSVNTPELVDAAKEFINKYASKIRWAKTICELGIGDGKHLNFFIEKYPDKKYYGNDFNPEVMALIEKTYPNVLDKSEIVLGKSTDKYLKNYIRYVDAIFTYNHLMYIPDDDIDKVCSRISDRTGKYILMHEPHTKVQYSDINEKAFINFGIGRDYTNMFYEFELKSKDVENVVIDNKDIEIYTYIFKRMG